MIIIEAAASIATFWVSSYGICTVNFLTTETTTDLWEQCLECPNYSREELIEEFKIQAVFKYIQYRYPGDNLGSMTILTEEW
jgi:hypothetical protein